AALLAILSPLAFAQTGAPAPAEPPPPPGIDDAGPASTETEAAPAATGDGETVTLKDAVPDAGEKVLPGERTAETTAPDANAPLPAKVRPADDVAPNVTIRQDDNVTIEEYRREGAIYMVRVTPKNGPAYEYLDTDGDGRLEGDPKEGPMQPVYYTVYEWQ
ncbi:MAG TPA: DUF2782 domain-containing protein, partial [Xanthomonadales bacterium]|nr:DUF2782 domain-containing protein [Xanthomonadales bacterium]